MIWQYDNGWRRRGTVYFDAQDTHRITLSGIQPKYHGVRFRNLTAEDAIKQLAEERERIRERRRQNQIQD
jgi:hypothetical protein